jgi:hypothetical protein
MQALYSKNSQMVLEACMALKQLCYMRGETIMPLVVERICGALTTLTSSHQTTSALEVLVALLHPIMRQRSPPPRPPAPLGT